MNNRQKAKLDKKSAIHFLDSPWFIILFLVLIFTMGLPLRMQNMKLDGYISDDAWWHYRHIKEVVDYGHRLNPDPYEFATLKRDLTYPPVFHYVVAWAYHGFNRLSNLVGWKGLSLIEFTHYFNLIEYLGYVLLIYFICLLISRDRLWSLLGALAVAVGYGMIIRAHSGELMAFALADLFGSGGMLFGLVSLNSQPYAKRYPLYAIISAILFGLSILTWQGAIFVWLPLGGFLLVSRLIKPLSNLRGWTGVCLGVMIGMGAVWYLPIILKYGIKPHNPEMDWFMNMTVLRKSMPLKFYFFASGVPLLFVPVALAKIISDRRPKTEDQRLKVYNLFLLFWIVQGMIATLTGWRGYLAVMPILSCVMIGIGAKWLVDVFFRNKLRLQFAIFIVLFLLTAGIGWHLSSLRLNKIDPTNPLQARSNVKSLKMLKFLRENFPDRITRDHFFWITEDEALGRCRMVIGQYLEYLPRGASRIVRETAKLYLLPEEEAYQICKRYGIELVIARKQFLELPKLSLLLTEAQTTSEPYMSLVKETRESKEVSITWTERGKETMLARMLSGDSFKNFEMVYWEGPEKGVADIVVYRIADSQ